DSLAPVRDSAVVEALSARKTAADKALLAFALLDSGRGEEAWTTLEAKAVSSELGSRAWFQVLRAKVAERADHLNEPARRDLVKKACELALASDPAHAWARRKLADHQLQDAKTKDG